MKLVPPEVWITGQFIRSASLDAAPVSGGRRPTSAPAFAALIRRAASAIMSCRRPGDWR
jgi:hypothetical protein